MCDLIFQGWAQHILLPLMLHLISTCADLTLDKAMATHSSILTWKVPSAEEPGRLQSLGSRRVGHN